MFVEDLAKWINRTPSDRPLTDLYETTTGEYVIIHFQAYLTVANRFQKSPIWNHIYSPASHGRCIHSSSHSSKLWIGLIHELFSTIAQRACKFYLLRIVIFESGTDCAFVPNASTNRFNPSRTSSSFFTKHNLKNPGSSADIFSPCVKYTRFSFIFCAKARSSSHVNFSPVSFPRKDRKSTQIKNPAQAPFPYGILCSSNTDLASAARSPSLV